MGFELEFLLLRNAPLPMKNGSVSAVTQHSIYFKTKSKEPRAQTPSRLGLCWAASLRSLDFPDGVKVVGSVGPSQGVLTTGFRTLSTRQTPSVAVPLQECLENRAGSWI